MAVREVDAISNAIIETEREIAGAAWDQEDTELDDQSGDRSLENLGEGLEGQHEAEDDEDAEGEEAEGETKSEAEGEGEAEVAAAEAGKVKEVDPKDRQPNQAEAGRVPSGKLREANERARAAEAALRDVGEKSVGEIKALNDKLELALRQIDDLRRAPRNEPPKPAEPPKAETVPDIFEDPKGFVESITKGFQSELSKRDTQLANQRVETSMAIAHAFHKDTFEKAFEAVNKLDPRNPEDRSTVQRIYAAPNPGEALVNWHKRNETFARVGNDPAKFEERIREETRQALLKDPEFRKALVAEMRGEAAQPGDDGRPRTTTRLPQSLNRAAGSNVGANRTDQHGSDDSEQSVADAAWR
jgi:hypothetical protein